MNLRDLLVSLLLIIAAVIIFILLSPKSSEAPKFIKLGSVLSNNYGFVDVWRINYDGLNCNIMIQGTKNSNSIATMQCR